MAFDPKELPPGVYNAFKKGPLAWPLVVQQALNAAIFNVNKLADIVFYLHHPERIGHPLKPHEAKLINQWKAFRTMVTPQAKAANSSFYRLSGGIEGTDVSGFG